MKFSSVCNCKRPREWVSNNTMQIETSHYNPRDAIFHQSFYKVNFNFSLRTIGKTVETFMRIFMQSIPCKPSAYNLYQLTCIWTNHESEKSRKNPGKSTLDSTQRVWNFWLINFSMWHFDSMNNNNFIYSD